jgi:uncharacterized protein (TIGR01777 family)
MKILMTGATGLIGKEIGKKLVSKGHEITVLTRNINEARSSLPFPAKFLSWEHYSIALSPSYFDNIDSVIHLAGESIAAGRWTAKRKKMILESRVIGTRNIVEAIKSSNRSVKQFISASAIGIYGDGQDWVDENSPMGEDFLSQVCQQWENESKKLQEIGVNVVNPRIGIVLSGKGGAMDKMLPIFSLGLGGVIGNGEQWMSWIHQDDMTNMFSYFVENPSLKGAFNAVAPNPTNNKDFSKTLARALGRGLFFPVPGLILKVALGDMSTLVIKGQKVSSEKITGNGFEFKYKNLGLALEHLCAQLGSGQQEITSEIWLPKKVSEVFPFFTDEKNLEKLTPEYLSFHVLKKSTDTIDAGTLIDYRLKLHGFTMKWRTLIESWEPGKKFVDRQIKGPYKLWHHTHEFEEIAGGTLMRDRVLYKLPLGRLGQLFSGPFVKADVAKIFSYRKKVIAQIFY